MVGRIAEYSRSIEGNPRVTFEVDGLDELRGLEGELDITVKKHSKRKSLNANNYFHKLAGLMADSMKPPITKARMKNLLLARYGQREIINDRPVYFLVDPSIDLLENENIHAVCVGFEKNEAGELNARWDIIRGTHTYDSREMSILIDGTVEDAKQMGVRTETPAEIERMKALWSQYYNTKKSATFAEG